MSILNNLINLLPSFYKEKDTYKVDGRGILERYLEIFGSYFEEYIVGDTKNILDIIDIDKTPEIYLNYLWQFLGEMPFAKGRDIDPVKWKTYFNSFKDEGSTEELGKLWLLPEADYETIQLDTDQVRRLLKYSISLFKIRGTKQFFEILFRIYGLELKFGIYNAENSIDYYGNDADYYGDDADYYGRDEYPWQSQEVILDSEDLILDDKYKFDKVSTCAKCIKLPVLISGHNYTSQDQEGFYEFYTTCKNILDRFLPINVSVDLYFGFDIDFGYEISLDPNSPYPELEDGVINEVEIKVIIKNTWGNPIKDIKFSLGCLNSEDQVKYSTVIYRSGHTLKIKKEGTYYIKCLDDDSKVKSFEVSKKDYSMSYKTYNISYDSNTSLKISPTSPTVKVPITASGSYNDKGVLVTKYLSIRNPNTLEILEPGTDGKCLFETDQPGQYTFSILDYPIKQISFKVTQEPETFDLSFHNIEDDTEIEDNTIEDQDTAQGVSVRLKVTKSYNRPIVRLISFYDEDKNLIEELDTYDHITGTVKTLKADKFNTYNYSYSSLPLFEGINYNIKYMRISCILDESKQSSQWVNIRQVKYGSIDKELISDTYTVLFPGLVIKMYSGGFISGADQFIKGKKYQAGEIVEDSDYQYSDYIDITSYFGSEPEGQGEIPNQLTWNLIGSKLSCHEIGRSDKLYYTGEVFTTRSPGTFYFKPSLGGTTRGLTIKTKYEDLILWELRTYPEQSVFRATDSNNQVIVTLQLIGRTKYSDSYSTIKDWLDKNLIDASLTIQRFSRLENVDTNMGDPIEILDTDSGWVDTEIVDWIEDGDMIVRSLQRSISYKFDCSKTEFSNYWKIYMSNRTNVQKEIHTLPYKDPDEIKLYLEPTSETDEGWLSLNPNSSSYKYDLKYGKPSFRIRGKGLDTSQELKITLEAGGSSSVISQRYTIDELIDTFSREGEYTIELLNTSIKHTKVTLVLVKNVVYNLSLNPSIEALTNGSASTTVTVTADTEVDPINLKVKLITDNIWQDNGSTFTFYALGDYNFHCYGDPDKVVTFRVMNSGELSTTKLEWDAESTSEKTVGMALYSGTDWSAEIEDIIE